jgi:hypothetical protein
MSNWSWVSCRANAHEMALKKLKKTFLYKRVLEFNFATITGVEEQSC